MGRAGADFVPRLRPSGCRPPPADFSTKYLLPVRLPGRPLAAGHPAEKSAGGSPAPEGRSQRSKSAPTLLPGYLLPIRPPGRPVTARPRGSKSSPALQPSVPDVRLRPPAPEPEGHSLSRNFTHPAAQPRPPSSGVLLSDFSTYCPLPIRPSVRPVSSGLSAPAFRPESFRAVARSRRAGFRGRSRLRPSVLPAPATRPKNRQAVARGRKAGAGGRNRFWPSGSVDS